MRKSLERIQRDRDSDRRTLKGETKEIGNMKREGYERWKEGRKGEGDGRVSKGNEGGRKHEEGGIREDE